MTKHSTGRKAVFLLSLALMMPLLGPAHSKSDGPPVRSQALIPADARASLLDHLSRESTVAVPAYDRSALGFEANHGQVDAEVQFTVRGPAYTLWLTPTQAVLGMRESTTAPVNSKMPGGSAAQHPQSSSILRLAFANANLAPRVTGLDKLPGIVNYFIGNDPAKWRTGVPTYAKVKYEAVYPGIDLVYYWNRGQLEYDFILAPGADPAQIRMEVIGADAMRVDEEGTLRLDTASGQVSLQHPRVYQVVNGAPRDIPSKYVWSNTRTAKDTRGYISFEVAAFDAGLPLIIDPVLGYSTYLGGAQGTGGAQDLGSSIAVDGGGNAYVTGFVNSTDYPRVNPIAQGANYGGGVTDAVVTKFSASGTSLVYSTYLGGDSQDVGNGIAVDGNGNAYVTGRTFSSNFPTANPLQANRNGTDDIFVTKLSSAGVLAYSTYVGSTVSESGNSIAVDANGQAYVTGFTNFPFFDVCVNPCVQTGLGPLGGGSEVFAIKLNTAGSALIYATFLGGGAAENSNAIAVDGNQNVYITGFTGSNNFPTQSAFQATFAGPLLIGCDSTHNGCDAFVSKLAAAGNALSYSTYLGGAGFDSGLGITVDSVGNAYVVGATQSNNFPAGGACTGSLNGTQDGYVVKFTSIGTTLTYCTYLGGGGDDFVKGIAVDAAGNAYVTGNTTSGNFPTVSALPNGSSLKGTSDDFVSKLKPDGSGLLYSTYLGGTADEGSGGIAIDSTGNAYVTGWTFSSDFPRASAIQNTLGGTLDAFVAKLVNSSGKLVAISTRSVVQAVTQDQEANAMIGGFVISGDQGTTKTVVIRARGPSLSAFGVQGVLSDPFLKVLSGQNTLAQNDDWQVADPTCQNTGNQCGTAADITTVGLSPCSPNVAGCDKEAAIYITLAPGAYTAIARGASGNPGIGLVEVYEVDATSAKLIAISTRGVVQAVSVDQEANAMIAGFSISGTPDTQKTVVIRVRGPSLSQFGVQGVLADPFVKVLSGQNTLAQNDDYQVADPTCQNTGNQCGTAADIAAVGLSPCSPNVPGCDKEAALYITLPPGAYTAIARGASGSPGIGLVEVFDVGN